MGLPMTISDEWAGLWLRIQRSLITALDFSRILVFDAVILMIGYGVTHVTARWTDKRDDLFVVAVKLSHGLFLLLYVVVVVFHIVEFIKDQRHAQDASHQTTRVK